MSDKQSEVEGFYDEFVTHQKHRGINLRHREILSRCIAAGLTKSSKVLEVGCGIGTVSRLLAQRVSKGSLLGVDISPKSIAEAQQFNKDLKQAKFMVSDMSDFQYDQVFDVVVFPDVLEHIPVVDHAALFAKIKAHTHENSVVCINIPAPRFLEWMIANEPEKLQIIDQPLDTARLVGDWQASGFYLDKMETYPIFYQEGDYQFFIFRPNKKLSKTTHRPKIDVFLDIQKRKFFK